MKILVTGASGYLGSCVAGFLAKRSGCKIYMADLRKRAGVRPAGFIKCDLTDPKAVQRLVKTLAPDQVYHFAGIFSGDYSLNYSSNFLPAKYLFDAVREYRPGCRVLVVGSAAEYGLPPENPVKENTALNPITPYGLIKMMQTRLAEFYFRIYGLDVVVARIFNVIGKGVSESLFAGRAMSQVEAYSKGTISELSFGGLDAVRDYLTGEEVAKACFKIMRKGRGGEVYNVGSGVPVIMRDLLKQVLEQNAVPYSAVHEKCSPLMKKTEVKEIYADISKLRNLRG